MELKPRVTLLITIGTPPKFNIKVIISEILVLKAAFCRPFSFSETCYIRRGHFLSIFNCKLDYILHSGKYTIAILWEEGILTNVICTPLCDCELKFETLPFFLPDPPPPFIS